MRLHEFFVRFARDRGVAVAERAAVEIRRKLSVRAPVRRTASGRIVATTPATPGAPPRYVSGRLYRSVTVIRTERGASLQVYQPYGAILDRTGHPFFDDTLREMGVR